MQAKQAMVTITLIAKAMILRTIPAVAIPEGAFFLAVIPRIKPTIAQIVPIQARPGMKMKIAEIIPSVSEAIAIPLLGAAPGCPGYWLGRW